MADGDGENLSAAPAAPAPAGGKVTGTAPRRRHPADGGGGAGRRKRREGGCWLKCSGGGRPGPSRVIKVCCLTPFAT